MDTTFGEWLKVQLEEKHLTQSELATRLGVYPPQVSRLISGERNPTNEMLVKISDALGIPRKQILKVAGIMPPDPDMNELTEQIIHEVEGMPEADQQEILAFIRMKNNLRQQRGKKK